MGQAAYQTQQQQGINVITCPDIVSATDGVFESQIKAWVAGPSQIHVIELKNVTDIKIPVYRLFLLFNQSLKAEGKKLFLMNPSKTVVTQLAQDGLSSVFTVIKTLDEALVRPKPRLVSPLADADFINPFISATKMVLETQANTTVSPGKAYIRKPGDQLPMGIAGVLSLVNPVSVGSISICFPTEVFLKIYENMVGEVHKEISPEIQDCAGELLNIIFGQAKAMLNDEKGHTLEKVIPTVLVGEKLRIHHQSRSAVMILPFESAVGSFHLQIIIERE